jgi:hypothetical protein
MRWNCLKIVGCFPGVLRHWSTGSPVSGGVLACCFAGSGGFFGGSAVWWVVWLVQDLRVTKKKPVVQSQQPPRLKKKVVQPAFHRVTSVVGLLRSYNAVAAEDPVGAVPDLEAVVTVLRGRLHL